MNRKTHHLLLTFFIVIGLAVNWCALTEGKQAERNATNTRAGNKVDTDWVKAEWTGDEESYRRVRQQLDKEIASGAKPQELARKYKQRHKWNKPLVQFKWGYAAYAAARKNNFVDQKAIQEIYEALRDANRAAPPLNFEYARLHFMTMARLGNVFYGLSDAGKRILKRNPKDNEVRFLLASVLSSGIASQQNEALNHVNYLIKNQPNKAEYYNLLGNIRVSNTIKSKNKVQEVDKAIAAYRKAYALYPPKSPSRTSTMERIKHLEEWKKRQT